MGAKESVLEISFLAFLHTEEFESITCLFSFLKSSLQNTNYVMEKNIICLQQLLYLHCLVLMRNNQGP